MLEQWEPVWCLILLRDESKRGIFREFWCNIAATKYKISQRALPQVFERCFDWVFLLSAWHKCILLVSYAAYWMYGRANGLMVVLRLHPSAHRSRCKCDQDTPTRFYLEMEKKNKTAMTSLSDKLRSLPARCYLLFLSGSSGVATTQTDTHSTHRALGRQPVTRWPSYLLRHP